MTLIKVGHAWIDLAEVAIATVENGMPVVYLKTSGVRVALPGADTQGEWVKRAWDTYEETKVKDG